MIIDMDYHIDQVPMCCRVCGQRLWKSKAKRKISYECNAFTADLKIAFDIDTSGDDVNTHPGRFCLLCKHSMERTISAIMKGVHHKCTVSVFQWQKQSNLNEPPKIVATQLNILIPVGTAIIIVAALKYALVSTSIPTVNM